MTRIARAIRIAFIPAVLCGVFGLLMNVNVTHAATSTALHLNRPTNVTVGSVYVTNCGKNGACGAPSSCISLSKQNFDYRVGNFDTSHVVTLQRYTGGHCDGNVNPKDQAVQLNTNGDTFVNVENF